MKVIIQQDIDLQNRVSILMYYGSGIIPRGDRHELRLLNGCIQGLEPLPVSSAQSEYPQTTKGQITIRVFRPRLPMGLRISATGLEYRSSYTARRERTVPFVHLGISLKNPARIYD